MEDSQSLSSHLISSKLVCLLNKSLAIINELAFSRSFLFYFATTHLWVQDQGNEFDGMFITKCCHIFRLRSNTWTINKLSYFEIKVQYGFTNPLSTTIGQHNKDMARYATTYETYTQSPCGKQWSLKACENSSMLFKSHDVQNHCTYLWKCYHCTFKWQKHSTRLIFSL